MRELLLIKKFCNFLLAMKAAATEMLDVLVIGGGIGGTALGLMLSKTAGLAFAVVEKDSSFASRKQGYGLTIQHHDAMKALGGSELEDQIRAEDTINDAHFIFEPDGTLCSSFGRFMDDLTRCKKKQDTKIKRYNVHLPRQRLRELLMQRLEKVPGNVMQWGWQLESIKDAEEDTLDANDARAEATLVHSQSGAIRRIRARVIVGADGIHSVVRKARVSDRPDELQYLGMLVVLGMTPTTHSLCLKTTFQTLNGDTRLFTMPFTAGPNNPDTTFWQLSFPCPENEAQHFRRNLPALRAELERRCGQWHAPVPELLRGASEELITATPVYDRGEAYPFFRSPPPVLPASRLTLIGDAAHPMSPFKGQGANQALLDAVTLGEKLSQLCEKKWSLSVPEALGAVERDMYARSDKKVRDSHEVAVRLHSATPLLDPSTRGISEALLQRFHQEKLGASTLDLRGRVLECLREVGVDAVKLTAPRLQEKGALPGIILTPGIEAFEFRGPWKGVSAAVIEHSGSRYPPDDVFVGNTNGLTLKYVLRATPGGAVVCEDGARVPVIEGTLLWLSKSAMYAFESDCTFLSISTPPFDPLSHRQAPARSPAPNESGRKVRVLESGPFAFPLEKANVGVARFDVEGRFPEVGALSNSKSRFLYYCCDAQEDCFLFLPELNERIPLHRGSLVHVNAREHFYWTGVMTLIAISSPKWNVAQQKRHQ